MPVLKKCPVCGRTEYMRENQVYCRKECKNVVRQSKRREERVLNASYEKLKEKKCPVCELRVFMRANQVFCSQQCANTARNRRKEVRRINKQVNEWEIRNAEALQRIQSESWEETLRGNRDD